MSDSQWGTQAPALAAAHTHCLPVLCALLSLVNTALHLGCSCSHCVFPCVESFTLCDTRTLTRVPIAF